MTPSLSAITSGSPIFNIPRDLSAEDHGGGVADRSLNVHEDFFMEIVLLFHQCE
jgi:hypothetical protein